MRFRRLCLLFLFGGLLMGAPAAHAQVTTTSYAEEAAAGLANDPVYVHPDAEDILSESEADRVRQAISAADAGPVYVAVLPEEAAAQAGGSADELMRMIGESLNRGGTYVVVSGNQLGAGSNYFPEGTVPSLATEAVQEEQGNGAEAVLLHLVDGLATTVQEGTTDPSAAEDEPSGSLFSPFFLVVLALLAAVFLISARRRRKRRQEEERRQMEEVREVATEDLVALGNDLRSLDIDIEMPGVPPAAKEDYSRALDAYQRASAQLDAAQRPADLQPVTTALEEGRYLLASARARLAGDEPPERRPPCFFDPRHGPSARDVEWAPPGGAPRTVPACAGDAVRVESGEDPQTRQVMVGGEQTDFYNAPYYFSPWFGGYFGGFGMSMMNGMLIGSMLGGFGPFGMGGFGYYGDGGYGGESGGDGGGGGDFGGGDFGGGGFGGGDFGGGDFGGGDFGGGDFG
ncbi:MAG: hypothetical protein M3174_06980 [Actinomycetota bacterium]|nr:hypothetical protein [Actinomycetota bacterium]